MTTTGQADGGTCPASVDSSDLVDEALSGNFDHFSPELAKDPHRAYDALREQCPIARSENYGGFWVFSAYEDVYEAYQNTDVFSSAKVFLPENPGIERPWIPLEIDPPDHSRYRKVLDPLFAPRRVKELTPSIHKLAHDLTEAAAERGECDYVEDFAVKLPGAIFLTMMGLPLGDLDEFLGWVHTTIHGVIPGDPDATEEMRAAAGQSIYAYFAQAIDDRTERRRDDMVSYMLDVNLPGEDRPLSQFEIMDICFLLLNAGLDTVAGVLGLTTKYLAEHPDTRAEIVRRLESDGELPHTLTEELLRWTAPVLPGRVVTKDTNYKGHELKKGDRVLLITPAACRDPKQFPNAHELDFDRADNRHITFAAGVHRCMGSHLARVEFKSALEIWHRRIPNYEIAPGGEIPAHVTHVTGLDHLPLVVHPEQPR